MPDSRYLTPRLQGLGTTVFSEMNRLAAEHGAVNLGQGAPGFDGPEAVKEAAIAALRAGHNQYRRSAGEPALVEAIAAHQQRFYDLDFDPLDEITVYAGATEAIFATLQALCGPGDEVVLFEPFYDSYLASVRMAGAEPRAVTLRAPEFRFDPEELAAAITPRTRLLLLNTPHNPSGRVFERAELETVAELCRRHDLIAVSDEVYEHLVYDGTHLPLAAMPGMRERTVTISSTGKTFSMTGWKIGYTCAPAELSAALRTAHQYITFCQPGALQLAMADALALPDSYYQGLAEQYRALRDRLVAGLRTIGFAVAPAASGYFVLADFRPLADSETDDDVTFCRRLVADAKVAAIPPTSFYLHQEHGRHLARFAFCKPAPVLDAAISNLKVWKTNAWRDE
jgi:N-succinyldiaminopimelate aminotransferase